MIYLDTSTKPNAFLKSKEVCKMTLHIKNKKKTRKRRKKDNCFKREIRRKTSWKLKMLTNQPRRKRCVQQSDELQNQELTKTAANVGLQ